MHGCREAVPGREVGGEAGLALRRCRQGRARAWGLIWYFSLITVIKISWMVCVLSLVFLFPQYFLRILQVHLEQLWLLWLGVTVSVTSCAFLVVLVWVFIWGHCVSSTVCTTRGIGGHGLVFRIHVSASSPNCSRRKPNGKT